MPLTNMTAKQLQRVQPSISDHSTVNHLNNIHSSIHSNSNHLNSSDDKMGFIKKTMQMGVLAGTLAVVASMFPMMASAETYQVVYHVVERGETLSGLSEKFSVSMNDLRKLNDMAGNNIQVGQRLLIPINKIVTGSVTQSNQSNKPATAKQQQSQAKTSNNSSGGKGKYKVVSGDTLGAIAIRHKVSLTSLLKANNISIDEVLRPNQVLSIPTAGASASSTNTTSSNSARQVVQSSADSTNNARSGSGTYTVKPGDMLISIANAYKVDVADIMELNGMRSDFLRVGQVLKIPKSSAVSHNSTTKSDSRTIQATNSKTYTVKSGDVLGAIADKHGIGLSELIKLNSLEGKQDALQVGQVLQLPTNAKTQTVESKPRIRDTVNKAVRSSGY